MYAVGVLSVTNINKRIGEFDFKIKNPSKNISFEGLTRSAYAVLSFNLESII